MRAKTLAAWDTYWNDPETTGKATKRLEPHPNSHVLDKYANLDRARSSLLVQARTQHISLATHLFRRKTRGIASPYCECEARETVEHVLLHCPLYADLREETLWGDGLRVNDLTELLGNPDRVPMTTRFLVATGRLPQFRTYGLRTGLIDSTPS